MKEKVNKKAKQNRILRFFKIIYYKLFRINDTPQKIAVGFGLGVFFGVMPGMGPFAALFFAIFLRVNRASALLASILTNTWLSVPVFLLSVKVGSAATGVSYKDIYEGWAAFVKNFEFTHLFKFSIYKIAAPVMIGYFIVSLSMAVAACLIVFAVLKGFKNRKKKDFTLVELLTVLVIIGIITTPTISRYACG